MRPPLTYSSLPLVLRSAAPRSAASSLDGFSPLLQERSAEDTTATAATLWRSLQAYLVRKPPADTPTRSLVEQESWGGFHVKP